MAGQWDAWLSALKRMMNGPVYWEAHRHVDFKSAVILGGDWTGAVMRGQVRASPDAGGAALATFTVAAPLLDAGKTTFAVSLAKATVQALPSDADADGITQLVFDILVDPAGASPEQLLFSGLFSVIGGVTQ